MPTYMKMKLTKLGKGDLYKLLRTNKVTIRELSSFMEITLRRIREVNKYGISGLSAYDYVDAINLMKES